MALIPDGVTIADEHGKQLARLINLNSVLKKPFHKTENKYEAFSLGNGLIELESKEPDTTQYPQLYPFFTG